ncbi:MULTISPECIES: group III truncated hemoglobin [Nonlabens]|uniref:Globin n=2 Tax=Nonlabens ulvanivorans TaxID=906888 RepID=A0A084JUW2_NONUL|nr:group III truncated hemoglobin [Nonlabens ulvanivorans]KEZ92746.1 globin [Nonlabens ulvanivorans]PRX15594.1 hemoglobin [Nonlabens ulvanivorans]WOI22065.1 group III truncated hemoglobin [Nonlabens ulvanivorans]
MTSTSLLNSREQIALLVNEFYKKVRKNEHLGPIFNSVINDWPAHLNHLTDFWDTSLLRAKSYHGNPIEKHQEVDTAVNHSIEMEHFGIWLQLWFDTIDNYFHGEIAQLAKNRARNMSTFIFLKIFEARKSSSDQKTSS